VVLGTDMLAESGAVEGEVEEFWGWLDRYAL
jgi:hypothetical protein